MNNKLIIAGTLLTLASAPAFPAENADNDPRGYYRAEELSLDVFGSASAGKYTIDHLSGSRIRHDARLGAGAALNYFMTRNLGVSLDAYSEDTSGRFVDSASANLILRLPLSPTGLAPYAFGGGGYQFDINNLWFAQLGAGLEYRFTPKIGVFADGRCVLPDHTDYYGVARLGLRFGF